ncbi:4-hydroxybenzoate polyprenyltransferase [Aliiroseovarius halocynthiae]|uniref:UbiA family prenyltransferase n=1 Tax=Aliiroseovarius halocynthiae TaxID=985055 RepID=A0A545SV48_9RHOB|nr:UbiA family prenyltransferase [Aliiroseovarius halocynthiae]TQV68826.1 UbiA family prenyltransferase [Aliiroseovarius halocynthiae]SMR71255.1 4-hydroxybenzoate polyprenyltransferase [Aliiroseovarius halocynthiae]
MAKIKHMKPLVLDVDGTFLRTDILFECFWAALGKDPIRTLRVSVSNLNAPARLKAELAEISSLRTDLLPVETEVVKLSTDAKADGREVILASASHHPLVVQLAKDHDLSERIFASDGRTNLKGAHKADVLVEAFGEAGFDYAGNASVDRAVWAKADHAIVVRDTASARQIEARGQPLTQVKGGWRLADVLRSFRPHQWVKNVLLLLPMIAAHAFDAGTIFAAFMGIIAFSAAASSIYLVNDLLDLEADRLHATKHKRPFASGAVPIPIGMLCFVLLAAIALGVASSLSWAFLGVVAFYMALSLAYSLKLKRMRWVDIAVLASLYTLRVVAGAAATGIYISGYLLVFIFPVFLALGCVKRLTELTLATTDERLPGRGYGRADRPDLLNVAGLGVVAALVAFFLYSFTEQAIGLYKTRWLIWVAEIPLAWWLIRMVSLGWHGKQDYDPIVFAMKDKRGIGLILMTLAIMFYAAGLWQTWFSAL